MDSIYVFYLLSIEVNKKVNAYHVSVMGNVSEHSSQYLLTSPFLGLICNVGQNLKEFITHWSSNTSVYDSAHMLLSDVLGQEVQI